MRRKKTPGDRMRRRFAGLALLVLLALVSAGSPAAAAPSPSRTVVILTDGQSPALASLARETKDAIQALAGSQAELSFREGGAFSVEWSPEGAQKALQAANRDAGARVIVALGNLVSAKALDLAPTLKKPVVLVFLLDPEHVLAGQKNLPPGMAVAGIRGRVQNDLAAFAGMMREKAETVVLVDGPLLKSRPDVAERIRALAAANGLEARVRPLSRNVDTALAELDRDARAVYVCPGQHFSDSERARFYQGLADRGIWAFSGQGRSDVKAGALAGQWPDMEVNLARHAALCAVSLLESPRGAGVDGILTPRPELAIGEDAARAVGYELSWEAAENAQVLEPAPPAQDVEPAVAGEPPAGPDYGRAFTKPGAGSLSVREAVSRAIRENADLASQKAALEMSRQEKNRVLTMLFPQVGGQLGYTRVDDNQAERSLEFTPLNQTTGGISVSQVIFSDEVISGLRAAGRSVQADALELAAGRLDISQAVQDLYLDCLAAGAWYAIAQFDLAVTDDNLNLARTLTETGAAGMRDVYRWEVQKAQVQRNVLKARGALESAMVALNQVMGTPDQSTQWNLTDHSVHSLGGLFSPAHFRPVTENSQAYKAFRTRMVRLARANSPEISALDKMIEAARIEGGRIKRSFAVPEVGARFDYQHTFDQDYASPGWPSGLGDSFGLSSFMPEDSENHWQLGVTLSWPLFEGGGRFVDLKKNKASLLRLKSLRTETSRKVEERAQVALITLSRALADMDITKAATRAADKNYSVSRKSYSLGESALIELLDAQHEMIVQKEAAILADYDYVRAVIELERSLGGMTALMTEEEALAFQDSISQKSGAALPGQAPGKGDGK